MAGGVCALVMENDGYLLWADRGQQPLGEKKGRPEDACQEAEWGGRVQHMRAQVNVTLAVRAKLPSAL